MGSIQSMVLRGSGFVVNGKRRTDPSAGICAAFANLRYLPLIVQIF
jgi:hypothetical protein